jgi:hypothetical protein
MKNCFAGHSMQKIRTTPLHRRKRAKEEGLRGSGSVASGMYTLYAIIVKVGCKSIVFLIFYLLYEK